MSNKKKAIFFDLDGTLWDAVPFLTESWNKTMEKNGYHYRFTTTLMKSLMGLTPLETCPLAFPNAPNGMELFKMVLYDEIAYLKEHPGTLYPHEREVLKELKELYPLYIISNSDQGYVENYLEACRMQEYFQRHLCQGDTKLDKWQNILYLKNLEQLDEVIYVGDTKKDMEECQKANVTFIHASYGFGVIENAKYKITSLLELKDVIKQIFEGE